MPVRSFYISKFCKNLQFRASHTPLLQRYDEIHRGACTDVPIGAIVAPVGIKDCAIHEYMISYKFLVNISRACFLL